MGVFADHLDSILTALRFWARRWARWALTRGPCAGRPGCRQAGSGRLIPDYYLAWRRAQHL